MTSANSSLKQTSQQQTPSAQRAMQTPAPSADIVWDDSKMVSYYADVVNLQSTREQVYLFFGTNQSWNLGENASAGPVRVELNSRVILSPHAAKRLMNALELIVKQYEERFDEIKI
jgi:hypothetical protein